MATTGGNALPSARYETFDETLPLSVHAEVTILLTRAGLSRFLSLSLFFFFSSFLPVLYLRESSRRESALESFLELSDDRSSPHQNRSNRKGNARTSPPRFANFCEASTIGTTSKRHRIYDRWISSFYLKKKDRKGKRDLHSRVHAAFNRESSPSITQSPCILQTAIINY